MLHRLTIIAFFSIFFFAKPVFAQDSLAGQYTEVSAVGLATYISKTIYSCFAEHGFSMEKDFSKLRFKKGVAAPPPVASKFVTRPLIIQFNVYNRADSAVSVCLFPGFYYKSIALYRLVPGGPIPLKTKKPAARDNFSIAQFEVAAKDSVTIIAEMYMARSASNSIKPRLIAASQVDTHVAAVRTGQADVHVLTYIFCGLLLMMILYSLVSFIQGGNREFLYYSLYALFIGAMLSMKAIYDLRPNAFTIFQEEYLDYIMQCLGIIFYMVFMQKFLETKKQYPFLEKLYNAGIAVLIASMTAFTLLHYATTNFTLQNIVENTTKVFLLLMIVTFLIYSGRRWNKKLLRYLFWGNLLLFIFSLISQIAVISENLFRSLPGVFNSALFYYEMGLFSELVLFLAGLNYKNRRRIIAQTREKEMLKAQNQMQEYEKQLAVLKAQQEERERISADMHDELGAGMTAIRLMSEIAKNKMKENSPVELERISTSANEVLNKMNAIIWSMNSGNDTLDNLVSYIRSYAQEYFDGTPVTCRIITPDNIPDVSLSGDKRRNIFLCVKESLNNILKHAGAAEVTLTVHTTDKLTITITDNGKGIDKEKIRQFGNGLKNISRRMDSIGGAYTIENKNGTVTTLTLPL